MATHAPGPGPVTAAKDLLRLVAIGSVDDGKSTLIGRLLYESGAIYQDQLEAMRRGEIDFASLTDGLVAEREQGITIDVAYRYWDTPTRRFVIADTPGHLQYTRNMVTGASRADAAIILIDASLGVLEQSRRHAYIAALLGVPSLIVAVNKMDLVNYDPKVFAEIQRTFEQDLERLGSRAREFIPISALRGDNVTQPSASMPWYTGPSLVQHLQDLSPTHAQREDEGMVFPVQTVILAKGHRRGYAGSVLCDVVKTGDEVIAWPSKQRTQVVGVRNPSGNAPYAEPGQATQLELRDELDLSRGDLIIAARRPVRLVRHLRCTLVWMHERDLTLGRSYLVRLATKQVTASITTLDQRMDLQTLAPVPCQSLRLNQIAQVTMALSEPCLVHPYAHNRELGSFVLIDRVSFATVAAGMVLGAREDDQPLALNRNLRAARFSQRASYVRIEPSTASALDLAAHLEARLWSLGHLVYRLSNPEPNPDAHTARVDALVDAGHLVLDPTPIPARTNGPCLTLRCSPELDAVAQIDAFVSELSAHGLLGTSPTSPPPSR